MYMYFFNVTKLLTQLDYLELMVLKLNTIKAFRTGTTTHFASRPLRYAVVSADIILIVSLCWLLC